MEKEGHLQNHVFYAARDEDDVQHLDSESTSRETGVEDAQRVCDPSASSKPASDSPLEHTVLQVIRNFPDFDMVIR